MKTTDVGEPVPIISYWWDENDDGAEPDTIDLTITSPSGAITTVTKAGMADISDGTPADTWQYVLVGTEEGAWIWAIEGVVDSRTLKSDGVILFGSASASPGPCDVWCDWTDVLKTCPSVEELADEDLLPFGVRDAILERVTWLLYMLDGGRYPGICTTTRVLCRECRTCHQFRCCCTPRDSIDLKGRFPVFDAWNVTIDGEVLARSAYRIRNSRWLDRIDGEHWPSCSDLTDPESFRVTWAFGRNPPVGLKDAAAVLAREFAKSCLDLDCELPQRVISINREGVSYVVLDSQKFLDEGRTGVWDVDLALIAARPPEARQGGFPGGGSPLRSRRTSAHRLN